MSTGLAEEETRSLLVGNPVILAQHRSSCNGPNDFVSGSDRVCMYRQIGLASSLPTTANQTDGNRGKKKCDYLGHSAQSLLAYPASELIGIPERDRDQREIDQEGRERKDEANSID